MMFVLWFGGYKTCFLPPLANAEENKIKKLYHAPTFLVPFSFFVESIALVPEGHNEDNLGFQVYLTSK